jgi:tripartite-type tricarboxylate transporter receptor subunit TctC
MTHIPYKGSSQALPQLVSASSAMMFDSIPASMPLVKAGKLRYLAVVSGGRSGLLPDVPTMAEAGIEGVQADNMFGMSAPKGTPQEAIDIVAKALQKVLSMPDLKATLAAQGVDLVYAPAAEMKKMTTQEYKIWGDVVSAAKVQPE